MSKIAGWNSTTIGYHIELINGYAFPSDRFTEGEGIPLIRIRDLNRHMTEVNYRGEYSERYVVKKGDLLVGMDGDFSTTQWKGDDSLYGKAFFVLASKQSTNLASINSTQLKGFVVPLPSYREQIEIEKIISGNEETIKIYQAELNKLLYFKRALMQDLLTGKVRVTPLLETKEADS